MRDAFLRAILESPEDDTTRLVFADWLDDNGELERAEFIRLQIRMEHLHRPSAEWDEAATREAELGTKLFGHLDSLGLEGLEFRRGFISSVTSGVLDFRDFAERLSAQDAPAFALRLQETLRDRKVLYDDDEAYDAAFGEAATRPAIQRCVSLDLPCLGIAPVRNLLSSPHWTNLRRLNAPESEAGPAFHRLDAPTFANLRWLNLSGSNSACGCAEIAVIAHGQHAANLEYLDFSANRMHGDDLKRLDESRCLNKLHFLNISENDVSDFDVSYFLFCGRGLPALKEFDLSRCFGDLTDLADAVIEQTKEDLELDGTEFRPLLPRLSKLWLRGNRITDAGAQALANYPKEMSLTLLDLSDNPVGEDGKRALRKRFGEGVCVFEGGGED
jgi:uncharacterized protein (TIGR02996 family)